MTPFKFFVLTVTALFFGAPAASAQDLRPAPAVQPGYQQFVVAEDVVVQYVQGELRFCQRQNLKGAICGYHTKLFGKKIFEVGNWWSPLTFAQAYTQLAEIEVTQVSPGPGPANITIYFRQVTTNPNH